MSNRPENQPKRDIMTYFCWHIHGAGPTKTNYRSSVVDYKDKFGVRRFEACREFELFVSNEHPVKLERPCVKLRLKPVRNLLAESPFINTYISSPLSLHSHQSPTWHLVHFRASCETSVSFNKSNCSIKYTFIGTTITRAIIAIYG